MWSMPWIAIWLPLAIIAAGWLIAFDATGVLGQAPAIDRLRSSAKRHKRVIGYGALTGALLWGAYRLRKHRRGQAARLKREADGVAAELAVMADDDAGARADAVAIANGAEDAEADIRATATDEVAEHRTAVDAMPEVEVRARLLAHARDGMGE